MKQVVVLALALGVPVGVASAQERGREIPWETCPCEGALGTIATVKVPDGFQFVGAEGTKMVMEATENPVSGNELGVVLKPGTGGWWAVFSFNDIGYVKDDEKDKLDADNILEGIRSGNEAGNEERRERGWQTLEILGWQRPPFYDTATNNLTWAIKAQAGTGADSVSVNHSVRLLGRGGVMNADLVLGPEDLGGAVPEFDRILTGFAFSPGNRYAEFKAGDKIAKYGLTALVAGGVGAAAMKSGLLAKFWKAIVIGVIALLGALKKAAGSLFGRAKRDGAAEGSA
jgi:uncharacterized membrane-anchored protein